MPELPEVQTTTMGLKRVLPRLKIIDVWTDLKSNDKRGKDSVKNPEFFKTFRKIVMSKKVVDVNRIGKNILIEIEGGNPVKGLPHGARIILIHMKMTGHLLYGKYDYDKKKNIWYPHDEERNMALRDPYNKFIHVVFILSNGKHLVFCDTRKFGKITIIDKKDIEESVHVSHIGPDPTDKNFTKEIMVERLMRKPTGKIKSVLMDQSVFGGIGNIYSDEMLWSVGIHPEERVRNIPAEYFAPLYKAMINVLAKGIDFGGDSMSDYRNIDGERGEFQNHHNVYRKVGEKCGKRGCNGVIIRKIVGGRSAHFCSIHQTLKKYHG
jgi:formamidopyrimidine-DNA glycosylase